MSTDARSVYGPSTDAIRRFLVRLAALGAAQRADVASRYEQLTGTPEWAVAERRLGEAMAATDRFAQQEALSGPMLQLVARRVPGSDEVQFEPIGEPALAAALTLMLSDVLDEKSAALLYSPFGTTIPREELVP